MLKKQKKPTYMHTRTHALTHANTHAETHAGVDKHTQKKTQKSDTHSTLMHGRTQCPCTAKHAHGHPSSCACLSNARWCLTVGPCMHAGTCLSCHVSAVVLLLSASVLHAACGLDCVLSEPRRLGSYGNVALLSPNSGPSSSAPAPPSTGCAVCHTVVKNYNSGC